MRRLKLFPRNSPRAGGAIRAAADANRDHGRLGSFSAVTRGMSCNSIGSWYRLCRRSTLHRHGH